MAPEQTPVCPKCGSLMKLVAESSGAGKDAKGWCVFRCSQCDWDKWVERCDQKYSGSSGRVWHGARARPSRHGTKQRASPAAPSS
jgi:hypothetical protein